jgi:hypothetical protein
MLDSGAFTELSTHGRYRHSVADYALEARRWIGHGDLQAIVAQDYMCEPWIIGKTGLSVAEHQRLTIERYDALLACELPAYIMPVLQGFAPADYARHVLAYGKRLARGAWVGVGSVCKRNGQPEQVVGVLAAIHSVRPDLRLHGFGIKLTALLHPAVRLLLHSADSMAWSYSARKQGRSGNDWREAQAFVEKVRISVERPTAAWQIPMAFLETT